MTRVNAVKCPSCGAPLSEYDTQTRVYTCSFCGSRLTVKDLPTPPQPAAEPAPLNSDLPGVRTPSPAISEKSRTTAFALCAFLGWMGAHRFYAEQYGLGVLYLMTGGLFSIGWLVDLIQIREGKFKDGHGLLLASREPIPDILLRLGCGFILLLYLNLLINAFLHLFPLLASLQELVFLTALVMAVLLANLDLALDWMVSAGMQNQFTAFYRRWQADPDYRRNLSLLGIVGAMVLYWLLNILGRY